MGRGVEMHAFMRMIYNLEDRKLLRKILRRNATVHETILWSRVKGKQLGCKFRRQHSIGPYIVDFYCPKKKLVVELDGWQHEQQIKYDDERTAYFERLGIRVLRFWNGEVNKCLDSVLVKIQEELSVFLTPPPTPSSSKEGRKTMSYE